MVKNNKWKSISRYLIILVVLVLLNIIASKYFFRIDLTEEKRYTMAPASKAILQKLDDKVMVEVFLDGELPGNIKRLQKAIREQLEEFKAYGGKNIDYRFTDPSAASDQKVRMNFYMQLAKKGINPIPLSCSEEDKTTARVIVPGALVTYKNKEAAVALHGTNWGQCPEDEAINQSIEGLEFSFINAIKQATQVSKKKIAYLRGHGEMDSLAISDLVSSLKDLYEIRPVNLSKIGNLEGYDAIMMVKPRNTFDEEDKLKIDQFVVNGGKALFFIDPVNIRMEDIYPNGTIPLPYNLNLDDLFFNFGVRLNTDLIQDKYSGYIPVVVGMNGNEPQMQMIPWRYNPVIYNFNKHPIVKNLDAVYTRFVSSIDSIQTPQIKKTPLMVTSKYSQLYKGLRIVTLDEMRTEPTEESFNKSYVPTAYLLEGKFKSLFAGKPLFDEKYPGIIVQNKSSKIVICSDGDLLKSEVHPKTRQPYPMGYDLYMKKQFANKDFMLNAINYLLDEDGLINVRLKEIKLRPLDKAKVKQEKYKWQLINIGGPIAVLLLFGLLRFIWRKRKYEVNK